MTPMSDGTVCFLFVVAAILLVAFFIAAIVAFYFVLASFLGFAVGAFAGAVVHGYHWLL